MRSTHAKNLHFRSVENEAIMRCEILSKYKFDSFLAVFMNWNVENRRLVSILMKLKF